MKQINFKEINCVLYLYGFPCEEELAKKIEATISLCEPVKKWFELAFEIGPNSPKEIEIFNVTPEINESSFGDINADTQSGSQGNERSGDYKDIVCNDHVKNILEACSFGYIYGVNSEWWIGIVAPKYRIEKEEGEVYDIEKIAATVLHEVMHVSQNGSYAYGDGLVDYAATDAAAACYLPNNLTISDCDSKYTEEMVTNQKRCGEHEVLPHLIEAETLAFLKGENCKGVLYNPDEAYQRACKWLGKK